jgi:hypothetical protein
MIPEKDLLPYRLGFSHGYNKQKPSAVFFDSEEEQTDYLEGYDAGAEELQRDVEQHNHRHGRHHDK